LLRSTWRPDVPNAGKLSREFVTLLTLPLTCTFASDCRSEKPVAVEEAKTVKNRVHLDLTTEAGDREAEIARLLALGARHVDIGQTGKESWTVLADPEGNEFCVIRPKTSLIR
jgi:hypothetical protein